MWAVELRREKSRGLLQDIVGALGFRLKQFRGLATRYAKRAAYYATEVTIAAIVLWLR